MQQEKEKVPPDISTLINDDDDRALKVVQNIPQTPIPWMQVTVLMFVTVSEGISGSILNPFAGLMVSNELGIPINEIGKYVGLLTTSFFVGQLISSYPLGWISDKVGRRPVILLGLIGNAVTLTLFGMSKWLWWAMLARFLNGFINSNRAAVKSYVREITDITNQARVYSYRSAGYAIGFVLGPVVGGLFARPAEVFPWNLFLDNAFFRFFPYLLPCLVAASLNVVGLALAIFFLHESLPSKVKKQTPISEDDLECAIHMIQHLTTDDGTEMIPVEEKEHSEIQITGIDLEQALPAPTESQAPHHHDDSPVGVSKSNQTLYSQVFGKMIRLDLDRAVVVTILLYGLVSLFWLMFQETYPVWAIQPDGLSLDEKDLGIINGVSAIGMIVFQVFFYHRIDSFFGSTNALRLSLLIFCPLLVAFPFAEYVPPDLALYAYMVSLLTFLNCMSTWSQAAVNLMINNASPPHLVGKVNGAAAFVASFARVLAPVTGTLLYSWSSNFDGPWPLNYQFIFVVTGLCSLFSLCVTLLVPGYVNRNRR